MYLESWGMRTRPFDNGHNPRLFVPVESSMLVLTRLRYSLSMGLGAVCLSGVAGSGKTEIARMCILDFTKAGWAIVYITNPSGSRDIMFSNILHQLEGSLLEERTILESLEDRISNIAAKGGKILLVVDDAHNITDTGLLDDIRMLYNIEVDNNPAISVMLLGQDSIYGKLSEASSFDSKLAMKIKLTPFNDIETETYMLSRIKGSGCTRGVFTKKAAEMVYEASGGIAGNINRVCELALVTAYANNMKSVKPEIVIAAAKELGLRNDLGTQRVLDEVWSDDVVPLEKYAEPEIDILADLDAI